MSEQASATMGGGGDYWDRIIANTPLGHPPFQDTILEWTHKKKQKERTKQTNKKKEKPRECMGMNVWGRRGVKWEGKGEGKVGQGRCIRWVVGHITHFLSHDVGEQWSCHGMT